MLRPTFDVDVAEPEIFNPESVVVPKPRDETESCVEVDEPTTKPTEFPATGLTASRADGVVVPTPTLPVTERLPAIVEVAVVDVALKDRNVGVDVAETTPDASVARRELIARPERVIDGEEIEFAENVVAEIDVLEIEPPVIVGFEIDVL